MRDSEVAQARKMREDGLSYSKISDALDIPSSTIHYNVNPKIKERACIRSREYSKTHKEDRRLYNTGYRKTHKEYYHVYNTEYRKVNKEGIHVQQTGYRETHRKERHLNDIKRYKAHKERACSYAIAYREAHLPEYAAYRAARKALIVGVTIGNLAEIKEIYRRAKEDSRVRCYLCGKLIPLGHRHVDHIIPLSKDGQHRPSNLAVACDFCNIKKRAKMPEEIGLLL